MKILHRLMLLTLILASALPGYGAWSETDGVYYIKNDGDGLEEAFTVDGSITYCNPGTNVPSYKDNGAVFVPKNAGEVISIEVLENTCDNTCYVLVYDGAIAKVGYGTSDGKDQSGYLPAGWKLKLQNGSAGTTYTSESADGKLSLGFSSKSGSKGTVKIRVSSVKATDMEYKSVSALTDIARPRRGAGNQILAAYQVTTEGLNNPLSIDRLQVNFTPSPTLFDNVRLSTSTTPTDETVVATAEGGILAVTSGNLRPGANKYYVIADIQPDASGTLPACVLATLKLGGTDRDVSGAVTGAPMVDNTIYMTEGENAQTFTISGDTDFFDAGGPDANYPEKTSGIITFKPSEVGKAIKIDFTELALFNTSSIGLNDVLKIYNGTEVNEANLLKTLLKENSALVKSAAADGSLTLSFTSTTGVPAKGWKAVVGQYIPGPMTISSVKGETLTGDNKTVGMGQQTPMILFDIVTDNSQNPMSLTAIDFTKGENVSAAKLYKLGDSKENTGSELDLTGLNAQLAEGHNYFRLDAVVNDGVANGAKAELTLNGVTAGGTSNTLTPAVAASRDVLNVVYALEGTQTVTLSQPWQFKSEEGFSGKYAGGSTDRIVIFKPATPGARTQLDFSEFAVYYASSSYSTRAVFEIYNGSECQADNIVWSVKSTDDAMNPPARIRSAAADGSLTVKFNPKASASYYCEKGWTATVKEFIDHDMTITGVTGTQNTSDAGVGASNVDLIKFVTEAEGTKSKLTVKSVALSLTGASAMTKVKVYAGTADNLAEATLFGEADAAASVTVNGSLELSEGNTYWWVCADIKSDAEPETAIDAALTGVTAADGSAIPASFNPEGTRTIKLITILDAGNHVVNVSRNLHFLDDGGADGKIGSVIGSSKTASFTFVPTDENSVITVNTSGTFSIGNGHMDIYSGREASSSNRLGSATGYMTTTGPANLTSEAADGSVTIVVKTPTGKTLDGFDLEIGVRAKEDFKLGDVTATPAAGSEAKTVRGSKDFVVLNVDLDIEGDKGDNLLNGITAAVSSDVTRLALYAATTNTVFNYAVSDLVAEATVSSAGDVSLKGAEAYDLVKRGIHRLFLVADFNAAAADGTETSVQLKSVEYNSTVKTFESDAAKVTLTAGLAAGEYSVGGESADYENIAAMASALEKGIEGPVTFTLAAKSFAETVRLKSVRGTSETNTLTIKGADRDLTVISPAFKDADKDGIVIIENTPYVTVRDLSVKAATNEWKAGVYVCNGSHDVTIDNIVATAPEMTSGYSGTSLVRTDAGQESGSTCDNFTLKNSSLTGGYITVYVAGDSYVARSRHQGARILNNIVKKAYSKSLYAVDIDNLEMTGNTADDFAVGGSYTGMHINRIYGGKILNNRIVNANGSKSSVGIQINRGCHDFTIGNNEVIITDQKQYGYVVQVSNDCHDLLFAHNTLRSSGASGYVFAATGSYVPAGIRLVNNIFQQTGASATDNGAAAIYLANDEDVNAYTLSNNAIATDARMFKRNSTWAADLDEMKAMFAEDRFTGNIADKASFLTDGDSHLTEPGNFRAALPLHNEDLAADKAGVRRNMTIPTIGAYEYVDIEAVKPEMAAGYPTFSAIEDYSFSATSRWNVTGKLYAKAVEASEEAPSIETLMSAPATDITADTDVVSKFTGLKDQTAYKVYYFVNSALNVESDVIATAEVTTLRHIEPLTLEVEGGATKAGEAVILTSIVAGGDEPYTYKWVDQMQNEVASTATAEVSPANTQAYWLTVTSADGQTATAKTHVDVTGEFVPATFEDNKFNVTLAPENEDDTIYSGSLAFNGATMWYGSTSYWNGYTFSNDDSSEFTGLDDQYRSAAGGGHLSDDFCVAFPQAYSIDVTNDSEGSLIPGMYVTNSAYTYFSMTNGDAYAKKFGQGDWYLLTVKGVKADDTEESIDFYLADLRSDNADEHYILDTWQWIDLSSFGKVTALKFELSSSDTGNWGMNTPGYFCIDDLGATLVRKAEAVEIEEGQTIDLADFFEHNADSNASENYSIVPAEGVSLEGTTLSVEASTVVDAQMTQAGQSQYIALTVTVDERHDGLSTLTAAEGVVAVEIYSLDGVKIAGQPVDKPVDVATGVYIVRYLNADGVAVDVRKIAIR